ESHVTARLHFLIAEGHLFRELDICGLDRQLPSAGHSIPRVQRHVQDDLFNLPKVRFDTASSASRAVHKVMSSPMIGLNIFSMPATTLFRLTVLSLSTCLRLNANSWPVNEAARSAARSISSRCFRNGSSSLILCSESPQ